MSVETARRFLHQLSTNQGLQTHFYVVDPHTPDKLLEFARGKGFIFTAEELETALNDFPSTPLLDSIRARARVHA